MAEDFTEEQEKKVTEIAEYIQLKERTLAALNNAIAQAPNSVYGQSLVTLATLLFDDKIPLKGAIDTGKYFPELYPRPDEKSKKKEKEE